MSSATYLLSDKNETMYVFGHISYLINENKILFSSWTYDRLLSNASIEKKDLSLIGFITGVLCIISIFCSFILRFLIYVYNRISSFDESFIPSPSISSSTSEF
jgi:hypothetical protein